MGVNSRAIVLNIWERGIGAKCLLTHLKMQAEITGIKESDEKLCEPQRSRDDVTMQEWCWCSSSPKAGKGSRFVAQHATFSLSLFLFFSHFFRAEKKVRKTIALIHSGIKIQHNATHHSINFTATTTLLNIATIQKEFFPTDHTSKSTTTFHKSKASRWYASSRQTTLQHIVIHLHSSLKHKTRKRRVKQP